MSNNELTELAKLTKNLFEALDNEVINCMASGLELSERSLELLEICQAKQIGKSVVLEELKKRDERQ